MPEATLDPATIVAEPTVRTAPDPTDLPVSSETREEEAEAQRGPRPGMALCLSGGGYRAMVFHVGALWRLNEAGLLAKLERVSSVSGGSITAGVLGHRWHALSFDASGVAQQFDVQLVQPIRGLASKTIDISAGLRGLLLPGDISDRIAGAYRKNLFGKATLQDLPDTPRFVINATNVQSAALWRFSKPFMADWRVGLVPKPTVPLANAVAASSAFPPFLSPYQLQLDPSSFRPGSGADLQMAPYTSRAVLTDGGVYDNLGLETAFKNYDTILVSDGGGHIQPDPAPKTDWPRHVIRVMAIADNQVRALRKRQLITAYNRRQKLLAAGESPDSEALRRYTRAGTYWGIRSNIADYHHDDALDAPFEATLKLAMTATRLAKLTDQQQERIINWGYAVCDAALRKHVQQSLPRGSYPYPGGVG
jgi:NTE family protein